MADLRDELRRAGLVSSRQARRLDREDSRREYDRQRARSAGDEEKLAALETEQEKRRRELEAETEAERRRQEEEVLARRRQREEQEHWERIHAILDQHRVPPGPRDQEWCFVASDGRVKRLRVSMKVARKLQHAELAIVERPGQGAGEGEQHQFLLVPLEVALRLEELHPLCLRFLNHPDRQGLPLLEEDAEVDPSAAEETTHLVGSSGEPFDEAGFLAGLE